MNLTNILSIKLKSNITLITVVLLSSILFSTETSYNFIHSFFVDVTGTISVDKTEVCTNEEAIITFEAENGAAPYTFTYELNGSEDTKESIGTNNSISFNYKNSTPDDYVFILTKIVDSNGTSQPITGEQVIIKVNTPPTVGFTFNHDNSCSGETIQFTNTSSGEGNLSYNWDFGDSKTSTQKNPTHIFEALGCGTETFSVKLTVTDENGCSTLITKDIDVQEKPDIEFSDADFGSFNNCGNASLSDPSYIVNVANNSNSTCIAANGYSINWGDGTTTTSASFPANHTYTTIGVFTMVISANGTNGCSNEVSYEVKNVTNPAGGFESPGNTSNLCIPTAELNFGITNWGLNSSDTEYKVDFGDGVIETYTQSQLEASAFYNSSEPNNSGKFPTPHSYNKGSCTETNGEFVATLTVSNACDSTEFTISNITVLEASISEFDVIDKSCINNNITFINNSTIGDNPGCSKVANFKWDFGDGTVINDNNTSTTQNQSHIYSTPGTYTATLTVTSRCGSDIFTKEICIEPEITPTFSVDNEEGCIPLAITATNTTDETDLCSNPTYNWTVSYNSGNCGTSEDWEFTNGTDATSENPMFLFKNSGKYTITQRITTGCGTETSTKVIDVKKPPTVTINPILDFCGTATLNPTATVENCTSDTTGITYNWTFTGGNPASANTLNPGDVIYNTPGVYEVTLEVTSECGVSNTATQTFEVFEKPILSNTDTTQEICSGQNTTEIILTTDNVNTTYSWSAVSSGNISGFSTNGTTSTIPSQVLINSGNNPETITYTVIPKLGNCEGDAFDFIITVNPSPVITTQPISSEVCLGGTATKLEVAYTNGTGTPSYQWFSNTINSSTSGDAITGATNSDYQPLTDAIGETFYYVEISFTSGGCDKIVSSVASVNVVEQLNIDPVTPTQTICVGGTADEFEVTFTGGTGSPSYQWYANTTNSNSGGNLINGATSSTYTPPVFTTVGDFFYYAEVSLDGNGCTIANSDVFEVQVLADPIIDTQPIASQELCANAIPTDLTVAVSGGTTSAKNYQWFVNTNNNTTSGNAISGANAPTYSPETSTIGTFYYYVVVSQPESDCAVVSDVSALTVNPSPIITTQPISSEVCLDGTATTLEVAYTNGTGTPSYQWYSNTIDDKTSGTAIAGATSDTYDPPTNSVGTTYYYAEISFSSGGCSKITSDTARVKINGIPVISNASITIYSEATFTFEPSDIPSNTVPTGTQFTWSAPTFNPAGSILGASAETNPQNTISQTLENTGTSPIIVTYTITPATPTCTGTPFILEVTVNPNISSNAMVTNITCFEVNDGVISTTIEGGIPFSSSNPYLIFWTGPNGFSSTNATITNLSAGTYTLRIEDSTGFFITEEWIVTQPDLLTITKEKEQNISCFQGNDGTIEVRISGGTNPYTFNWTTTNGSGIIAGVKNQNTLTAGTYILEVIDQNNCVTSTSFTLTEPEGLAITTTDKQNVLCFGEATGSISLNVTGGTKSEVSPGVFDYIYNWSGPNGFTSSTKNINNLIAGVYTVAVTDNLGCTTSSDITINESPEIIINYTKTDVSCYGATDGALEVTVEGGAAPYQISWSNFGNGFTQSNLEAGTYVATITDANNCVEQVSIEINQPLFFIDPDLTPISCNGANDGSIRLNLTGGIAPIRVTWDDDPSAGVQRNNLSAGTYKVTIIDSDPNQCPIEETFVFTNPPAIAVSSTVSDAIDCTIENSGFIDLTVTGGTAPYSFNWSNGATTEDLQNISKGDYTVTITDANGCSVSRQFSIFRQDPIEIEFTETLVTNCVTKTISKRIEANVLGGFLPHTLSWSSGTVSGVNNQIMTTDQNGSYQLTVTDDKGCIQTKSVLINDIPTIGDLDFRYSAFALNSYDLLSIEDPIQFTNLSTGDISLISWDFGDGSPLVKEENPVHTYDTVGNYTITLTITYESGCTYTMQRSIDITIGYQLIHPTGFTPNGDGFNETIRPKFTGFTELEMNIYDSWGTKVYFEKGTSLNGWDGTIKGKPAENGNYIMVVIGTTFYNKTIKKTTTLTLLK